MALVSGWARPRTGTKPPPRAVGGGVEGKASFALCCLPSISILHPWLLAWCLEDCCQPPDFL